MGSRGRGGKGGVTRVEAPAVNEGSRIDTRKRELIIILDNPIGFRCGLMVISISLIK
jgi:hypothetical protein